MKGAGRVLCSYPYYRDPYYGHHLDSDEMDVPNEVQERF